MLAHIFLPHVLDVWFEREGRAFLMRVADDCCIGCEREGDARKSMAVLPKRFARLGLTIHPEKMAVIACGKPDARQASAIELCISNQCLLTVEKATWN